MTTVSIAAGRTVCSLLDAWAERQPEREFLVYENADGAVERFSWGEMAAATRSVAAQLKDLGIGRGSMINLHLANCPAFLAAWFACARLGAVIVPTNTAASPAELEYVLSHCEASASVVDEPGAGVVEELAQRLASLGHVVRAGELNLGGAAAATAEPVGTRTRRPSCTRRAPPPGPRGSSSPTPTTSTAGRPSPTPWGCAATTAS